MQINDHQNDQLYESKITEVEFSIKEENQIEGVILNEKQDQEIMKKKQIRNNRKRSKHSKKERAFRIVKILGQGAFANVYMVETKETG